MHADARCRRIATLRRKRSKTGVADAPKPYAESESRAVTRCYTDAFGLTLLRSTRFRLAHKLPLKGVRAIQVRARAEKQAADPS
ncbi:hypothetical protein [Burkholderia mallei]|nr:hypothetical protein [Burkholderia mallei]